MKYNIYSETKKQVIEKRQAISQCKDIGKLLILITELDFLKWRLGALNNTDSLEA